MMNFNDSIILDKLKSGYQLPPFSKTAAKLIEIAAEEKSSLNDLANLIEKDPSLTIRVLKLANSAFFKTLEPVSTIEQAIMRIGFHQLRLLALSLSLRDIFPFVKIGNIEYELFWKTSLYRGLLAKGLATKLNKCKAEEAFVAGLTLEIGLLIYFDLFKDFEINETNFFSTGSLLSIERQRTGITHREIGEIALKFWNFPENITLCQRYNYEQHKNLEMPELAKICCMAEKLSVLICYEKSDFEHVMQSITSSFGLTYETIYDVAIDAMNDVNETAKILDIEVKGENDILGLMEKANRALIKISERICDNRTIRELPSFETLRLKKEKNSGEAIKILEAVAHEIKNPLTAVSGFARRLAKTLNPSSEGWRYVEIILKEAQRLEYALDEVYREVQ